MNIKKLAGNRAEEVGIHRFLNNDDVTQDEIEGSFNVKTIKNIRNLEDILVINDTTEVSFPSQKQKKASFGSTGNRHGNGFFMHPNIVVNPKNGCILGLAGVEIWQRTEINTKKLRHKKPLEKKESYKWIRALEKAQRYLGAIKRKTFVTDRESDIYEYMNFVKKGGDHFIVRAMHNRKIEEENTYLKDYISKKEVLQTYELLIKETPKRKSRLGKLHVKYGRLNICRPQNIIDKTHYDEKLTVSYVDIQEDDSTAPDKKSKIHWLLLTTYEIDTPEDAIDVIERYKLRWTIELIFAASKKRGLDIESCQITDFDKLKKLVTLAILSVIQVFYLVKARDGKDDISAQIIFSDDEIVFLGVMLKTLEGKTQKQKNLYLKGGTSWASWIISRLGGWKGYASERAPGYGTIHHGLQKFYNMYQGWKMWNV